MVKSRSERNREYYYRKKAAKIAESQVLGVKKSKTEAERKQDNRLRKRMKNQIFETSLTSHSKLITSGPSPQTLSTGHSNEDFIKYAKEKMNDDLCKEAEGKTKDQKHNCLWHELRFGRITASTVYEASRYRTTDGSLVHRAVGAAKVFDNVYMKRGRQLEYLVIIELEKKLQIKIKKCGLFLIPSLPMLGASPDAIGRDFIVEIKCPSSEKTIQNYISEGQISEKCKGQIHLQMMAAKKKKALFCAAHPQFENNKEFQFLWIDYDQKFTMNMTERAVKFWKEYIFPILFKSFTG